MIKTTVNSDQHITRRPLRNINPRIFSARALCLGIGLAATAVATTLSSAGEPSIIEDIFAVDAPFAIGHRGSGNNQGEDPTRPLENTRDSVQDAFKDGISIVEVDVQITSDGKVVTFHDDFLSDYSCINAMTFKELKKRTEDVSLLKNVLNTARSYRHRHNGPSGLMIVEMKAPAPLCDPGDVTELAYVSAVIDVIRERDMEDQVLLESFSPTLLQIAATLAPEIERALAVNIIQFLSPEQVEAATGLLVTVIDKNDFGLQWGEIGQLYRLPGYQSIEQFIGVSFALGARAVTLDSLLLFQAELTTPGSGAALVSTLQSFGFPVLAFTLNTEFEWQFAESMGVDGIITDNIPLGLELQGN